jgi:hypothetical protein
MNEDGPNGSPYGTLAKHDQSETKRDRQGNMGKGNVAIWMGMGKGNTGMRVGMGMTGVGVMGWG